MKKGIYYDTSTVGGKVFKVESFCGLESETRIIRSFIDSVSGEFKYFGGEISETDKPWYKLLCLWCSFEAGVDLKGRIKYDIARHIKIYNYYERLAKRNLINYIILLRTGVEINAGEIVRVKPRDPRILFFEDMTVDELTDLLKEELSLRITVYYNKRTFIIPDVDGDPIEENKYKYMIEIEDVFYDFNDLYKEYGIDPTREYHETDPDYEKYNKFVNDIRTAKHSERRKSNIYSRGE